MSNPYTSVALTGYNADAPPDDGTRTAANQLTWAKHKTKIGDPLKAFVEAMNSNVLAAFAKSFGNTVVAVATNYSITVANQGAVLSVTGERTLTLPAVATAGSIFSVTVVNLGTSVVTVDGNGAELVNGAAAIYLGPGESAILSSDGAAWTAALARAFPNRIQSKAVNYLVAVADRGNLIDFTAAATLSLPTAASAGAGFAVLVSNSSIGAVTVNPDGAELVQGQLTLRLVPGAQALLVCDGSKWLAVVTGGGEQSKCKTADETVNNSNTLQDDDHLNSYDLVADGYYEIVGMLRIVGTTASDFQFALVFTDAPQKFALTTTGGSTSTPSSPIALALVATDVYLTIDGFVRANAAVGGTMKLQWAQNTPEVADTKVLDGSWLKLKRVA